MIAFTVRGDPATQGNKSAYPVRRKDDGGQWYYTGKVAMVEGRDPQAREKHRSWREAVKAGAVEAMSKGWPSGIPRPGMYPLQGPLVVSMIFGLYRPRSHYRTGRNAHLLRVSAPPYPAVKPDLGKLARAVEDALKDAGLIADDAQIVAYRPLMKLYVGDADSLAPAFPGVKIQIRHVPHDDAGSSNGRRLHVV